MRGSYSGNTLAFQANAESSILLPRSSFEKVFYGYESSGSISSRVSFNNDGIYCDRCWISDNQQHYTQILETIRVVQKLGIKFWLPSC